MFCSLRPSGVCFGTSSLKHLSYRWLYAWALHCSLEDTNSSRTEENISSAPKWKGIITDSSLCSNYDVKAWTFPNCFIKTMHSNYSMQTSDDQTALDSMFINIKEFQYCCNRGHWWKLAFSTFAPGPGLHSDPISKGVLLAEVLCLQFSSSFVLLAGSFSPHLIEADNNS